DNNNIFNNTANYNNWDGILLVSCADATVTGNTLSNNVGGIGLESSTKATISGNNLSNNGFGISLLFSSTNATISGNNMSSNNWDGILLVSSADATVTGNTLSDNAGGISLVSSVNIRVHHNNLVSNLVQAYDDGESQNTWDDDYPSGGNYWSDYTGTDQLYGPLQNVTGSDGIGDSPYVIDFDSRDRYPLISPSSPTFPRPPLILIAELTDRNMENVTLIWIRSPDDGSGLKSVVGYEIFRNSTYDSRGLGYGLLATVPNGTFRFVDNFAGEGNPNDYFYLVCAVDLNNNTTCVKNQAGKFTRSLSKGPNLVSVPFIQSNHTLQAVLQTVSYDNAWSYDPINQEWKSFMKSKPYGGTLQYVNHTIGIWVNVTQDSNLTVAGVVPTSSTISLHAGWNLVGFPSFGTNYTIADLKVAVAVERIEGFDGSAPPYFLRVMADGDFLQTGFGYW
ncbi:MAG: right-handed parallel beta-helix repeat-containing protein, partial [Thermoplasmata archaeon]|nr:right-handed parallel beta-helix repeat-containing protein [Thermoplasmata archaeon]